MNENPRSQYWNEQYLRYWKDRVTAANTIPAGSPAARGEAPPPSDRVYEELVAALEIPAGGRVLELGCGYGRAVPILSRITPHIAGIDISEAMISEARANFAAYPGATFQVSEAEHTPFPESHFDRVICFGVFDALYQREALIEMNRILVPGGRVLITGKNDCYFADDENALVAERNARAKGHPNYFTAVATWRAAMDAFGFKCVWQRYHARRGDMAAGRWTSEMPDQFYEYCLILEKTQPPPEPATLPVVSDAVSKTYRAVTSA